ncbi:sodium-dependent transporter [Paenibacillus chungangensis]|uniref:Transporter n=1 Tax=Paenibacillus chungangensis TaxID=696535 RepID=A0ABW3HTN5_9BACL
MSDSEINHARSDRFSSTGFILAAVGSSVGLGNMWKFPYITGLYGGAAFVLLFIFCILLIGLPILLAELTIGRSGRGSASLSMARLGGSKAWGGVGLLPVTASFLIMAFYSVVAGWTLHYAMLSFSGVLTNGANYEELFAAFVGSWVPICWEFIVTLVTAMIIVRGVSAGIERFNKLLIPALVLLLIVLAIRSMTLEGAGEGLSFFFRPDFSKLTTESALVALGQAFFSLSLGMGTMMTYGAYVDKRQSLGTATLAIGLGNLLYALLAGLIIFPAIFVFGIAPTEGAGLVFVALPAAFAAMPFGSLIGGTFFLLLALAAITSAVSALEVPSAFVMDAFGWSRSTSVLFIAILSFLVGVPCSLSLNQEAEWLIIGGQSLFNGVDFVVTNVLLPLSGLIVTIFAGYIWKGARAEAGLHPGWLRLWLFMLRIVSPVLVLLVLLYYTGVLKL